MNQIEYIWIHGVDAVSIQLRIQRHFFISIYCLMDKCVNGLWWFRIAPPFLASLFTQHLYFLIVNHFLLRMNGINSLDYSEFKIT
jgi:hypothetical protein